MNYFTVSCVLWRCVVEVHLVYCLVLCAWGQVCCLQLPCVVPVFQRAWQGEGCPGRVRVSRRQGFHLQVHAVSHCRHSTRLPGHRHAKPLWTAVCVQLRSFSNNNYTTTITILRPLYSSTCVSQHLQLRTGGFCRCKVLLPTCPCWRQPVHFN